MTARIDLPGRPRADLARERDAEPRVTEITRGVIDAVSDLADQYIALAKIEVKDELLVTVRRGLWYAAAWAVGGGSLLLLAVSIYLLAEGLIESPGIRLLIIAVLGGIAAFALVLCGDSVRATVKRAGPTNGGGAGDDRGR